MSASSERVAACRHPVRACNTLQWLLIALGTLGVAVTPVRADSELVLTWQAPDGCPDAGWAARRVSERLGRALGDRASEQTLSATATLHAQDDRFVLVLHTEQGGVSGDRTLAALSCAELSEAAVLVLALAVDPDAVARVEQGVASPASAETDRERPPFLAPPAAPKSPPARPSPVHSRAIRVDGLFSLGQFPGPTGGASLALAYAFPHLRSELSGYWLWPREGGQGETRVRTSLWALRPTLCRGLPLGKTAISLCLAAELGRAGGRGKGVAVRQQNYAFWLAGSLGPRLDIPLMNHVFLLLETALLVPLNRARFVTTDAAGKAQARLYEASPVAGRATLGIELRF